jgi:hypothetical protein
VFQRNGDDQTLAGKPAPHRLNGAEPLPGFKRLVDAQHEPCRVDPDVEAHGPAEIGEVATRSDFGGESLDSCVVEHGAARVGRVVRPPVQQAGRSTRRRPGWRRDRSTRLTQVPADVVT